jgi:hypothetical protein
MRDSVLIRMRARLLLVVVVCLAAFPLVGNGTASAYVKYNCGYVAAGGFCNPPVSAWGRVLVATWESSTVNASTLPVRINRGSIGPTAWQWVGEDLWASFPYAPEGWAQVKNTTAATQQLTIIWEAP